MINYHKDETPPAYTNKPPQVAITGHPRVEVAAPTYPPFAATVETNAPPAASTSMDFLLAQHIMAKGVIKDAFEKASAKQSYSPNPIDMSGPDKRKLSNKRHKDLSKKRKQALKDQSKGYAMLLDETFARLLAENTKRARAEATLAEHTAKLEN